MTLIIFIILCKVLITTAFLFLNEMKRTISRPTFYYLCVWVFGFNVLSDTHLCLGISSGLTLGTIWVSRINFGQL